MTLVDVFLKLIGLFLIFAQNDCLTDDSISQTKANFPFPWSCHEYILLNLSHTKLDRLIFAMFDQDLLVEGKYIEFGYQKELKSLEIPLFSVEGFDSSHVVLKFTKYADSKTFVVLKQASKTSLPNTEELSKYWKAKAGENDVYRTKLQVEENVRRVSSSKLIVAAYTDLKMTIKNSRHEYLVATVVSLSSSVLLMLIVLGLSCNILARHRKIDIAEKLSYKIASTVVRQEWDPVSAFKIISENNQPVLMRTLEGLEISPEPVELKVSQRYASTIGFDGSNYSVLNCRGNRYNVTQDREHRFFITLENNARIYLMTNSKGHIYFPINQNEIIYILDKKTRK